MMSRRKFKVWINSLLDEGYDLSGYTWDELYDEYLNEAGNPGGAINRQAPQRARNQRIQQNLTSSWAQQQLNKNSPYAPSTAPTGLDAAARALLTTPRPNYNPPPSPNEKAFRDTGGFAAQAQRATDPVQKAYYNTMSQKASTVNASTLAKPEGQKVTAGREYDATLKGKPVKVTYDLTGKRSVKEEFEAWVDELHEQGYDLSRYTWEGLFEHYCDAVLSEANPTRPISLRGSNTPPPGGWITNVPEPISNSAAPSTSRSSTATVPAAGSSPAEPKLNPATTTPRNLPQAQRIQQGLNVYDSLRKSGPASANAARDVGTSIWKDKYKDTLAKNVNQDGTQKPQNPNNAMSKAADEIRQSRIGYQTARASEIISKPGAVAALSPSASTTTQRSGRELSAADQKQGIRSSFDFGKSNYITEDMNYLYHSIYEGNRVDQDEDGDNDGADVMIARMIASGMSREEAIRRTRKKPYNKKGKKSDEELKEFAALIPLVARAAAPLAGRLIGGAVARGVAGRVAAGAAEGGLQSALGRMAGNAAGNLAGRKVRKKLETMGQQDDSDEESTDESLAYEILDHLIENGYADTPEQAAAMFENFSEDYQYAIIEHLQSF